jgi:hypothetical protein
LKIPFTTQYWNPDGRLCVKRTTTTRRLRETARPVLESEQYRLA